MVLIVVPVIVWAVLVLTLAVVNHDPAPAEHAACDSIDKALDSGLITIEAWLDLRTEARRRPRHFQSV